jgi:uncharacterized protein
MPSGWLRVVGTDRWRKRAIPGATRHASAPRRFRNDGLPDPAAWAGVIQARHGGIVGEQRFRFAIRVKPGARRPGVGGSWAGGAEAALLVAVAAPAVEGRANEAVRRAVAGAFGLRPRDVTIVSGERSRDKIVELDLAPAGARERLGALLRQPPHG